MSDWDRERARTRPKPEEIRPSDDILADRARMERQNKAMENSEMSQMQRRNQEIADLKLRNEGWTQAEIEQGRKKQRDTIQETYGTVRVR